MNVFLSYSMSDVAIKETVGKKLVEANHQLLTSTSMNIGAEIIYSIGKLLNEADAFIFIVSHNSLNSNWQMWEWRNALERSWEKSNLPLLGIVIGDIEPPLFLQDQQFIRVSDNSDMDDCMNKVLARLNQSAPPLNSSAEGMKDDIQKKMEVFSREVSKFRLTEDDLTTQIQWILEKIDHFDRFKPDSREIEKLRSKLARILKIVAKGQDLIPIIENGLAVLECNEPRNLQKQAKVQTVLLRAIDKLDNHEGAINQICRALEISGIDADTGQVKERLQQCREKVPVISEMLTNAFVKASDVISTIVEEKKTQTSSENGGES